MYGEDRILITFFEQFVGLEVKKILLLRQCYTRKLATSIFRALIKNRAPLPVFLTQIKNSQRVAESNVARKIVLGTMLHGVSIYASDFKKKNETRPSS